MISQEQNWNNIRLYVCVPYSVSVTMGLIAHRRWWARFSFSFNCSATLIIILVQTSNREDYLLSLWIIIFMLMLHTHNSCAQILMSNAPLCVCYHYTHLFGFSNVIYNGNMNLTWLLAWVYVKGSKKYSRLKIFGTYCIKYDGNWI